MIWNSSDGVSYIGNIAGTLYRLVESQEQVATMGYVDTLDEQALLEEMLEQVKPPYLDEMQAYHYLLTTPFRYPPLNWGSRFGRTNESSLFYAACKPSVSLAESAYYRFIFLYSMEDIANEDKIRSEHLMFSVNYQTDAGVKLQFAPFDKYKTELTDPSDYTYAQQLGSDMRAAGVEAFEYESARDLNGDICVALYNVLPFCQREPKNSTEWLCETSLNDVVFKQKDKSTLFHFPFTTIA